ncbi:hypothetical protein OIU77_000999 [Salix suchowensis]|uniref:Uncharacterized protein n=1 Tax=Salix suchowensis TaxID=1278906 RepID=A0ABQ9B818_9ROSI|nr:hypothetical protein OIU77_000999 [Salix suchowensis]
MVIHPSFWVSIICSLSLIKPSFPCTDGARSTASLRLARLVLVDSQASTMYGAKDMKSYLNPYPAPSSLNLASAFSFKDGGEQRRVSFEGHASPLFIEDRKGQWAP